MKDFGLDFHEIFQDKLFTENVEAPQYTNKTKRRLNMKMYFFHNFIISLFDNIVIYEHFFFVSV